MQSFPSHPPKGVTKMERSGYVIEIVPTSLCVAPKTSGTKNKVPTEKAASGLRGTPSFVLCGACFLSSTKHFISNIKIFATSFHVCDPLPHLEGKNHEIRE
jgi:hypothetical protein